MFIFLNGYDRLSDGNVTLKLTETYSGDDELLPFYYYDIYNKVDIFVGKISIRIGENYHSYYNGHIGYEIFDEHRGNRYSYYASKLVIDVARAHNMTDIYITCKQSNLASMKIIERLGAIKKEVAEIPNDCFFYYDGIEDYCIYRLSF